MVAKKAYIVVGLGYGDEGKGITTDYLCLSTTNQIVVRFNGGHQAGHTVVTKSGVRHVFSCFGSGTLRNIPTYWSKYCTFSPVFFYEEFKLLRTAPKIYIDESCPVTTHYDILYNRAVEKYRGDSKHGSCGVGFGATIQRSKNENLNLIFSDFFDEAVYIKIKFIREYYRQKIEAETTFCFNEFEHDEEDRMFFDYIDNVKKLHSKGIIEMTSEHKLFHETKYQNYIFEGAQGILLDINYGEKPHVTKSNTTSKNALDILSRQFYKIDTEIFYVTRAYSTRHGAGPFKKDNYNLELVNNSAETNTYNIYQEEFRVGIMNIDLINFAIGCDNTFSSGIKKNIVITCLDQLKDENVPVILNGITQFVHYNSLSKMINESFSNVLFSYSDCSENLKCKNN